MKNTEVEHHEKLSGQVRRLRRYRQRHKRIDYIPSPDVLAIIEHHRSAGGETCLAGIIDGLIRVGHRTISGNAGK